MLTPEDLNQFRDTINEFSSVMGQKPLTWKRENSMLQRFGEDPKDSFTNVILPCIANYNYMRSWPVNFGTDAGKLERQSVQVLLNKDWLNGQGYLTVAGDFNYDKANDRFLLDGILYRPEGDTSVAQAGSFDLFIALVLQREESAT